MLIRRRGDKVVKPNQIGNVLHGGPVNGNVIINNVVTARVYEASDLWLAESGYRLISVNTETADNSIYMVLLGEGELPSLVVLKEEIEGKTFGKTVKVETVQAALKYLQLE